MNLSFLLAGFCLLAFYSQIEAGSIPDAPCQAEWVVNSCDACQPTAEERVECTMISQGKYCCNRPDLISGGMGELSDCQRRALSVKTQVIASCLTTAHNIMLLHAINREKDTNPYEKYVCQSFEDAMDCVFGTFSEELGFADECSIQEDFYPWVPQWMLELSAAYTDIAPDNTIFNKCFSYEAVAQCPDKDNVKSNLIGACVLRILGLPAAVSSNGKCINWKSCMMEVQMAYEQTAGEFCKNIKELFTTVESEAKAEFSSLIGVKLDECSACAVKSTPFWPGITECLTVPLQLLNLSSVIDLNDNQALRCDAYKMAMACIKFRYIIANDLGIEGASPMCNLQSDFHPLFVEYMVVSSGKPTLSKLYNQCTGAFSDLSVCPNQSGLKAALIGSCAMRVRDLGNANTDMKCRTLRGCVNDIKSGYKTGYKEVPSCDTDGTFDSIIYNSAQMDAFKAIANFDGLQCFGCSTRVEYIRESVMECLASPIGLLNLRKHLPDASLKDMVCPAYSAAIECIRGRHENDLGLSGSCSIAENFHTMFLAMIKEEYDDIPSEFEQEILQCTSAFTTTLECPTKEKIKEQIVYHCAGTVMDFRQPDYQDVQCVVFGDCFGTIMKAYLKEAQDCSVGQTFDELSKNTADNQEFAAITGFNPMNCRACINRVAPYADPITNCLQNANSMLKLSIYFNLSTKEDIKPFICKAYYVSIGCIKKYAAELGLTDNSCSLMDDFHPLFLRWIEALSRETEGLKNQVSIFQQCTDEASISYAGTECPNKDHARTALIIHCSGLVLANKRQADNARTCGVLDSCIYGLKEAYKVEAGFCPIDQVFDSVTSDAEDIALFSSITDFPVSSCTDNPPGPDDSDLMVCSNVQQLIFEITAGKAKGCLEAFTAILVASSQEDYCTKFWTAMGCAAKALVPTDSEGCLKKMHEKTQEEPAIVVNYMKETIGLSLSGQIENYARETDKCDKKDSDVCSNVDAIYTAVTKGEAANCVQKILEITAASSLRVFCTKFWDAMMCIADALTKDDYEKRECIGEMKRMVDMDPSGVIHVMQKNELPISEQIYNLAKQANTCEIEGYEEDDDDDLSKLKPVIAALKKCGKLSEVVGATQTCDLNLVTSGATCAAFKSGVSCVASNLVEDTSLTGDLYNHMMEQCIDLITAIMIRNKQRFQQRVGNFDIKKCMEQEEVCGDGHKPLADVDCSNDDCPNKYVCTMKSYCCPAKKPGMCPMMKVSAPCVPRLKTRCSMDMDCEGTMKCCDQGCGYMTCEMTEVREKSSCELGLERAKERLYTQGACGDGTGVVGVPQCQNSMYGPIQGDVASGVMFCVDENGMKIPGSEFRGNKDCPRTRAGRCPAMPSVCQTAVQKDIIETCSNDEGCQEGKKCCYSEASGICAKTCRTATDTTGTTNPMQVCPSGQERHCCPVNLIQGKVCHANRTAVPRINPCGGCTVEFYSADGKKVNCEQGVSTCQKKKAMSRMMNREMKKNYASRLKDFVEAHEEYMDGDDKESMDKRFDLDIDMDGYMDKDEYDGDDKMADKSSMMDEYGNMARRAEQMETDERITEISMAFQRSSSEYMGSMIQMTCSFFNEHGFCQNGGTCNIGGENTDGYLQLCQCAQGYFGLFCEFSYELTPNTRCMRYKIITDTILEMSTNVGNIGSLLHGLLSIFQVDHDILPAITCDSNGMFDEIQHGIMLPIGDMTHMVGYCVDNSTGVRKPFTRIALMDEALDCSQIVAPDVLSLPKRCRLPPGEVCADDSMACQYYYNPVSQMCEKSSRVGYGFDSITQCYQECGLQVLMECPPLSPNGVGICPVCPDEGCPAGQMCCPTECGGKRCIDMYYTPQPCRSSFCDYKKEFCLVEEMETGPVGRCKALKSYCMQDKDSGYGDKEIGAYYFDGYVTRCSKFTYMGQGGNTNRFYNLHQCQTECGVFADYKFPGPVCPIPSRVHKPGENPIRMDTCNGDHDCMGNMVCCSNGYAKVCVYPVDVCGTQRCSPEAKCVNDMCVCPTCEESTGDKVCGSNGNEYKNLCMLKKHACETMRNITVAPCNPITPPRTCPLACTKQYMPVCAYNNSALKTFSNPCMMMNEIVCNGNMYNILYNGECIQRECEGTTCQLYETCVDGRCVCPTCGVTADPVCGHADEMEQIKTTFGSMCEMRRHGCLKKQLYIAYSMEPCMKPEPSLECPATRSDIVHSAVTLCHPDTDAYCGKDSKCCPYGAGYRCIPMKYLVQKKMEKPGFCPIQSYVNFNRKNCYNKAYMCTDDSDAPGNAKCCENLVCGHKTIALPLGLADENVCGDNRKPVRGMMCDLTPGVTPVCPSGSTCTEVMSAQWKMGVCCQPINGPEPTDMDVYGNRLCKAVSDLGLMPICQNNGTCVGNVHGAKMCECPVGFVGAFCEKMLRPYENPCTVPDVQCFVNPCDNNNCYIEGAVCKQDYCGACTARWSLGTQDVTEECTVSKCERLKNIMSKVFSLLPNDDTMPSRRRRGVPTNTNEGGESDEGNGMTNIFTGFNVNQLSMVMKDLKYSYVPQMGEVVCEMDGSFSQKQCYQHVSEGGQFCTCVDSHTGMRIKNAPKAATKEALDCSFVTAMDFPEFCKEVPSMAMCSDIKQERYYFSPEHGDCVSYMEMGCNGVTFENSFSNYNSCRSVCSHRSVTPAECATIKCGSGTACKKMMGKVGCYSVTSVMATHDYPEPTCDMNGDYSPRQCQGNLCYCVNKDGTPVQNSFGDGQNLVCKRDANGMTTAENVQQTQRKRCANGATIRVCDGPGDPCNNCEMRQTNNNNNNNNNNMNMMGDPNIDNDGTCKNCQTCPAGQGMMTCTVTCDTMPVCAQFPQAVCKVDPCTCTAKFYKSNNKVVNCEAAQSRCEREKTELEKRLLTEAFQRRLNNSMTSETPTMVALKCAADGSYFARCVGDECYCLNAASGESSGARKTAATLATIDDIDCSVIQKKTAPKQITIRAKISNKRLAEIPEATRTKIKETYKNKIERKNKVKVTMIELIAGSVLIDVTTEYDPNSSVVSDTQDLASIANNVELDLQEAVEVDGTVFVGSETSITAMLTEGDLVQTTTAKPTEGDETNTGLIIGVVIGGVALLLIIIVAIVLYNRSKKQKSSSMRFSDIKGKDNPYYNRA